MAKQILTLPMFNAMKRRCGQPDKCEYFDRGKCKCLDNGTKNQKGVFYKIAWEVRQCKVRTTPLEDLMSEEDKIYHEKLLEDSQVIDFMGE
jgi:hypothetical protein